MSTVTVSMSETANPQSLCGCVVFSAPLNRLSPDVTASQRTRHNQQRHARAAAGYVGQETIDTVGTIGTGTWQGDPIAQEHLQLLFAVTCLWEVTTATFAASYTYANGQNGVGATITAKAAGTITADSHQLRLGDTVLVLRNTLASVLWAGVYEVTTAPSATVAGVLTRHPAFNRVSQFLGASVNIQLGNAFSLSSWICTGVPTFMGQVGFTFAETMAAAQTALPLFFCDGSASITVQTSSGLDHVIYNDTVTVSINDTWVGQTAITTLGTITTGTWAATAIALAHLDLTGYTGATSITTLGTIATGTWAGTAIAINHGGTGQTTAGAAFDALSPMTTLGDVIYGGTSGTNTRLAGNTTATRKFLRQTGTGAVSAAPAWDTLAAGDIPDLSSTYETVTALSTWPGTTNIVAVGTLTSGTWNAITIAVNHGGTGATTAAGARANLGAEGLFDRYLSATGTGYFSVAALTAIYTLSVTAGTLGTNSVIRVRIAGTYGGNSGSPTLRFQIVYGATTVWDDASPAIGASVNNGAFEIDFLLATADGSASSQIVTGKVLLSARNVTATTGTGALQATSNATFFSILGGIQGTAAENSALTKNLVVNFLPSVNNGTVGLTVYSILAELIP